MTPPFSFFARFDPRVVAEEEEEEEEEEERPRLDPEVDGAEDDEELLLLLDPSTSFVASTLSNCLSIWYRDTYTHLCSYNRYMFLQQFDDFQCLFFGWFTSFDGVMQCIFHGLFNHIYSERSFCF